MKFSLLLAAVLLIPSFGIAQDAETPAKTPVQTPTVSSKVQVFVTVTKNRELDGKVVGISELKIKTNFGEASIPLTEIEGIKTKATDDGSAVVAFKNGDMVTGKLDLTSLSIDTDWGQAKIPVGNIDTIMMVEQGRFFKDETTGTKQHWRFTVARPVSPPTTNTRRTNTPARTGATTTAPRTNFRVGG